MNKISTVYYSDIDNKFKRVEFPVNVFFDANLKYSKICPFIGNVPGLEDILKECFSYMTVYTSLFTSMEIYIMRKYYHEYKTDYEIACTLGMTNNYINRIRQNILLKVANIINIISIDYNEALTLVKALSTFIKYPESVKLSDNMKNYVSELNIEHLFIFIGQHTRSVLKSIQISKINDLNQYSYNDIFNLPKVGKTSFVEITSLMKLCDIHK